MLPVLLFICFTLLALIYINGIYNENYWRKRGVAFDRKNKVMGVFWDFLTKRRALFELFYDIYKEYPNEPAVGIGSIVTPSLYIRDPINIQHVLTSDFNSFSHRGFDPNEGDILSGNILFLNGPKWKLVRQSMSPLFTSAKLKSMYYIMDKSAQDFVRYLKDNPKFMKGDMFNTLSTFCSAAICASVFGVTTKSVFDSPFLDIARRSTSASLKRNVKFTIASLSESLFKMLDLHIFKEFENFFITAIKQVIHQRKVENVKKYDFADICVSLQKQGMLKDMDSGLELEPTDELLAAQAFFFLIAGVEPTASAMLATLMEVGKHTDVQKRLQKEIDEAFDKHGNDISYDVVANMEYLDMVTCEAMRLNPSIGFLARKCVKDTVLPTGNIKVDKGTNITLPIYELHHDPKYHPDPEIFNPERFSVENRKKMLDITYMPFGKGNRNCVGMRYAQLQAKSGLVQLLRNFSVNTNILEGGVKHRKELFQVKISNVDIELIPRRYN
ncbi:cytochrome P450 6B5-like isoform X2 [Maniola jurtina]|uniref:cytochrome P450 6B5-like isoform X1 n=1 Tax=Maniola jurtina TaxID=191418 RepID=UPI001E68E98C|nr:cytochrome P450 6B5-like isoform X1 [Maniola jurtina]XP_045762460.1 cytochrome P450 6B5-like isoform X2 [Maniola jurtina]